VPESAEGGDVTEVETIKPKKRPPLRAVILTIRPDDLVDLFNSIKEWKAYTVFGLSGEGFDLPAGCNVTAVDYDFFTNRLCLRCEHESFPEVPEATQIPTLPVGLWARRIPEVEDRP
jgi:hypothetical protein